MTGTTLRAVGLGGGSAPRATPSPGRMASGRHANRPIVVMDALLSGARGSSGDFARTPAVGLDPARRVYRSPPPGAVGNRSEIREGRALEPRGPSAEMDRPGVRVRGTVRESHLPWPALAGRRARPAGEHLRRRRTGRRGRPPHRPPRLVRPRRGSPPSPRDDRAPGGPPPARGRERSRPACRPASQPVEPCRRPSIGEAGDSALPRPNVREGSESECAPIPEVQAQTETPAGRGAV